MLIRVPKSFLCSLWYVIVPSNHHVANQIPPLDEGTEGVASDRFLHDDHFLIVVSEPQVVHVAGSEWFRFQAIEQNGAVCTFDLLKGKLGHDTYIELDKLEI